ncbi:hypothetical protein ACFX13_040513 [Malus domestica]
MDHTFTLRWTMPSSVPFAARPFPNSNGVIFRRIHSVPVIRLALGSESCGQWENKKEALTPYGPMTNFIKTNWDAKTTRQLSSLYLTLKWNCKLQAYSKSEASKSHGNRLPRSFQEKLDERAARGMLEVSI